MNREQRRALRKAASLLIADARLTRESCSGGRTGGLWACGDCAKRGGKCNAQRSHDARLKAAKNLKALAGDGR